MAKLSFVYGPLCCIWLDRLGITDIQNKTRKRVVQPTAIFITKWGFESNNIVKYLVCIYGLSTKIQATPDTSNRHDKKPKCTEINPCNISPQMWFVDR